MRKLLISVTLLLVSQVTTAGNVLTDIFRYECKHASAEKDGFTCTTDRNGVMHIRLAHDPKSQSEEKNEYTAYQLSKLLKSYHSMPDPHSSTGRASKFYITADYWPATRKKSCSFIKTQLRVGEPHIDRYSWTCQENK
ncbi:MAG: hypothetical protein D6717_02325 [Gammaproteobacteria bacterium]|nr:MAG: hypothetical protein D6717_02325 [Gammaproteobacteria bacterium]